MIDNDFYGNLRKPEVFEISNPYSWNGAPELKNEFVILAIDFLSICEGGLTGRSRLDHWLTMTSLIINLHCYSPILHEILIDIPQNKTFAAIQTMSDEKCTIVLKSVGDGPVLKKTTFQVSR